MAHESPVGIVLGCLIFGGIIVWAIAEAIWLSAKLTRFLRAITAKPTPTTYVDQTINQMYGDVHVEREYAGTRNAAQQIKRGG